MRDKQREEGQKPRYDGRCRNRTQAPEGDAPFVIRFLRPTAGEVVWQDKVQGEIRVRNDELDDLILVRSDGSPTYNLAVVVDDHDMGINLVIRGEDHLSNTPRQIQLFEALSLGCAGLCPYASASRLRWGQALKTSRSSFSAILQRRGVSCFGCQQLSAPSGLVPWRSGDF